MLNPSLSSDLKDLLRAVVLNQRPELISLVEHLGNAPLTSQERETLREVVAAELCATGLREDWEPNERGLLLEHLIDLLGHL